MYTYHILNQTSGLQLLRITFDFLAMHAIFEQNL